MMKRGLILLFACLSMTCMAALQYGVNIEQANDYVNAGLNTSVGWTITAKQDVTLWLNSDVNALTAVNRHMTNVIANAANGTFSTSNSGLGYFVYNTDMKSILSVHSLDFSDNLASIDLKAGETIGFWMQIGDVTYSSVRGLPGYTYNVSVFGGGDSGNGNKVYNFANGWYKDAASNTITGYEQSFLLGMTPGKSKAPVGQPLPGIVASLLIGGSAVGVMFRRRRSTKK